MWSRALRTLSLSNSQHFGSARYTSIIWHRLNDHNCFEIRWFQRCLTPWSAYDPTSWQGSRRRGRSFAGKTGKSKHETKLVWALGNEKTVGRSFFGLVSLALVDRRKEPLKLKHALTCVNFFSVLANCCWFLGSDSSTLPRQCSADKRYHQHSLPLMKCKYIHYSKCEKSESYQKG